MVSNFIKDFWGIQYDQLSDIDNIDVSIHSL